jgi:hypothetical protein
MLPRRAGHPLAVINVIWRGAIIIAPLFLLGYCGLAAYRQFNPTFLMSPLDAHVFTHCNRLNRDAQCDLIPAFFSQGDSVDDITRRMIAAGYRHGTLSATDGTFIVDDREVRFTDYYSGQKGSMSLGCGYELAVDMRFDSAGRLEAALGDNSTACL